MGQRSFSHSRLRRCRRHRIAQEIRRSAFAYARLGADVVCHSFIVEDLYLFLLASLLAHAGSRRKRAFPKNTRRGLLRAFQLWLRVDRRVVRAPVNAECSAPQPMGTRRQRLGIEHHCNAWGDTHRSRQDTMSRWNWLRVQHDSVVVKSCCANRGGLRGSPHSHDDGDGDEKRFHRTSPSGARRAGEKEGNTQHLNPG